MATPVSELAVQTAMTAAYIGTRPVSIILTPYSMLPDGSGGKKRTAAPPRTPQQVRFIEETLARRTGEIGEQFVQAAELLCMPEMEIAVNDEFTAMGGLWKVEEIYFPNEWSVRATVLRYGR